MGSVLENALRLLSFLYDAPSKMYDGPELADGTGLSADQLNVAVEALEEQRSVKVVRTLGNKPFDFMGVRITARGRMAVEHGRSAPPPAPPVAPVAPQTHIYYLTGHNPRVTHGTDASHNIVQLNEARLFEALRDAMRSQLHDEALRSEMLDRVDSLERARGGPAFAEHYFRFMGAIADHAQVVGPVVAPFIAALGALVRG